MKIWNKDPCGQSHIETTPVGKRFSDGIIWASEASGFYRVSSSDIVWSRSMIEESGGCLDDDKLVNPEPSPCRLIPWFSRQYHPYDVKGAMTRVEITVDGPAPVLIVEVCQTSELLVIRILNFLHCSLIQTVVHFYKNLLQHAIFLRFSSLMILSATQAQAWQDMYAPFPRSVTKSLFR